VAPVRILITCITLFDIQKILIVNGLSVNVNPITKNLFVYSLFNDVFSISDYIASNERMIVNNELGRMWKEAVVA
jgi:hypothetical protein